MASITWRGKNGDNVLIQFLDKNGRKRGVSLTKMNKKTAAAALDAIEKINDANIRGSLLDRKSQGWLEEQGEVVLKKLAKVELIEARVSKTLGEFIEEHLKSMVGKSGKGWKPQTLVRHEITKTHLLAYFKPNTPLASITEADADAFARHLQNDVPTMKANSTRYKHISNVKTYFRAAVRHRLISNNPFESVRLPKRGKKRYFYVKPEIAEAVLEACPSNQWKLVFALARYGGVRTPSEIENLKWGDIKWAKNRMLIHSPKTEHHEGRDKRNVPLWDELRVILDAEWESLTDEQRQNKDDVYVVTIGRKGGTVSAAYLRGRMRKIIENAGFVPWPKVFQNCRSTRQTELSAIEPAHKVCRWLGNSEKIFQEHYDQETDEEFDQAVKIITSPKVMPSDAQPKPPSELLDLEVMQKLMTQFEEVLGNDKKSVLAEIREILTSPDASQDCSTTPKEIVTRVGVEPYLTGLKDR